VRWFDAVEVAQPLHLGNQAARIMLIFVHNNIFCKQCDQELLIVKDSMVLIHLAIGGVLKQACIMFGQVIIPHSVHKEVVERGTKGYHADAYVVQKLEKEGQIKVVAVTETMLMDELKNYGLHGGELEAVTLYIQEKADLIASNDDKVRRLRLILNLDLVSSLEIVFMLAKNKVIAKEKALDCIGELKRIGWFSRSVIDSIIVEVEKLG
jgi:predicted nucleic acid-binding protein